MYKYIIQEELQLHCFSTPLNYFLLLLNEISLVREMETKMSHDR